MALRGQGIARTADLRLTLMRAIMSALPERGGERDPQPVGPANPYLRTFSQLSPSDSGSPLRRRGLALVLAMVAAVGVGGAALYKEFAASRESHRPVTPPPQLPGASAVRPAAPPAPPRPAIVEAPATPRAAGESPTAQASRPALSQASPARRAVRLPVGQTREFRVVAQDAALGYRWTLDDRLVGIGSSWSFAPTWKDLGRRRIVVEALSRGGTARRQWTVRVRPPRPPRVLVAVPGETNLAAVVGDNVRLRYAVRPATPGEKVRLTWLVDGKPTVAKDILQLPVKRPGVRVVRAIVTTDLGAWAVREWRINVAPPPVEIVKVPAPPPVPPTVKPEIREAQTLARVREPAAPATKEPVNEPEDEDVDAALARLRAADNTAPPSPPAAQPKVDEPPTPAPKAEPGEPAQHSSVVTSASSGAPRMEDVQGLLERYAAALRTHDVNSLRAIGQVTSDEQARAMRDYFENVGELDVQFRLQGIRWNGDVATVTFTRLDRFHDPAGRLTTKESPPVEKTIQRTPQGLRFVSQR